jgi:hypothetical protein
MARTNRRNKRQSRRRSSKHRGFLGGSVSNPALANTSATVNFPNNGGGGAGWVEGKYGNEDQQYNAVFDIGSKTLGNSFTILPASQTPTPGNLALIQSAGARRRGRRGRGRMTKKRGGFLMGEVINQAVVPFGLLALQNRYGRRKSRMNKSRRSRRFRR